MKKEVKALLRNLPAAMLVSFNESDITANDWEEEGREFEYKGDMYDVVKTDTINGKVTYHCFNDSKESDLYKQLLKAVKANEGNKKNNQKTGIHFVKNYNHYFSYTISGAVFLVKNNQHHFWYNEGLCCLSADIQLPPPRC